MDQIQGRLRAFLCMLITVVGGLLLGLPAGAHAGGETVAFTAGPSGLVWQPLVPYEHGVLTVASPDGTVFREEFEAGVSLAFNPFAQPGAHPPDGTYIWEVRLGRPSAINAQLRAAALAARESGDADIEAALRAATTQATQVQSGAFQILHGAIVPSTLVEPRAAPRGPRSQSGTLDPFRLAEWFSDDPSLRPVDQVIPDDLIVQGSACVGLDCVNGEVFGFDTIRLKENNTRIQFDDTSTAAGFPTNNWQIRANSSASGGESFLGFVDQGASGNSETGTIVFSVAAGTPANSVKVSSTGKVGFRTATPVLDLHMNTSDTPAVRFEQNSSGGFTAQTWDIAGNEANFFVRDVTGGSRLPFRIRPGAPTSSIDIAASGRVGIGTATPGGNLHIAGPATADVFNGIGVDLIAGPAFNFGYSGASFGRSSGFFNVRPDASAAAPNPSLRFMTVNVQRMIITNTGNVGIGTTNPTNPLQMASGAFVSAGGVWTDASSREVKQDIRSLTGEEARAALERLDPVKFAYLADPAERHVGFIAEDVPDLVASKDRKTLSPMDIVAVLTRVVQEQQKAIAELTAEVAALRSAAGPAK